MSINQNPSKLFVFACKHGYFELAQHLIDGLSRFLSNYERRTFLNNMLTYICENGLLSAAQFMLSGNGIQHIDIGKHALYKACSNGHLHVAQLLFDVQPSIVVEHGGWAFTKACKNGQLNVAQWLFSKTRIDGFERKTAFSSACCNGHLAVAQWLVSLYIMTNGINVYLHDCNSANCVFRMTCSNGHLNVAQWLLSVKKDIDILSPEREEMAFVLACQNGHLEVAQWLLCVKNKKCIWYDNQKADDMAFYRACSHGHLKVAQWLLSVKPDINISAKDEASFRLACEYGHLEVAQWLLSVKEDIDISATGWHQLEYAFYWACCRGHLEVAQWLLSVKKDINISAAGMYCGFSGVNAHEETEQAFRNACKHNHLPIVEWFHSLNPDKYRFEYNVETQEITCLLCVVFLNAHKTVQKKVLSDCVVCYESENVQTPCGHSFCNTCIRRVCGSHASFSCPYCRQSVDEVIVVEQMKKTT